jgi:hypothetical protein
VEDTEEDPTTTSAPEAGTTPCSHVGTSTKANYYYKLLLDEIRGGPLTARCGELAGAERERADGTWIWRALEEEDSKRRNPQSTK